MKSTRRTFIKAAAVGAGAAALTPVLAHAADHAPSFNPDEVGMLYDSTLCVGCKACVYSCRKANFERDENARRKKDMFSPLRNSEADFVLTAEDALETRWVDVYDLDYRTKNIIKMYNDPDTGEFAFVKRQCMHCNAPGCVSACPVKAMTKDHVTGVVEYDRGKCIGCRYCQLACPFNIPAYEWHKPLARIIKCELCRKSYYDDQKSYFEKYEQPACCDACPAKAVIYGKRADLLEEAKRRIAENPGRYVDKVYGEFDYGGTNVLYISKVDFNKLGMPDLPNYSYATKSEKLQHTIYTTIAHVPVAPVVLYATLATIAVTHRAKRNKNDKGGRS
ncbi:MAG: hydrogenase 2 operon protein HybA [Deferribacteraceae bacterium]|jgi:Fe-S-cluster-containing dehydrogenase component|nr:hydrogenase 2 operon protein HybA [Deferribacteraceae bacterium]